MAEQLYVRGSEMVYVAKCDVTVCVCVSLCLGVIDCVWYCLSSEEVELPSPDYISPLFPTSQAPPLPSQHSLIKSPDSTLLAFFQPWWLSLSPERARYILLMASVLPDPSSLSSETYMWPALP